MTPYIATITTDKYAACYKDGGMVIVRLKDGASCVLDARWVVNFHSYIGVNLSQVEGFTLAVYVDDYFATVHRLNFTKRKWIVVRNTATVIEFHNPPIGEKPNVQS